MGIPAQDHRGNVVVEIAFGDIAASGCQGSGQPFDSGVGGEPDDDHVPVHGAATPAFLVKKAFVTLYPPGFKFLDFHIGFSFQRRPCAMGA